MLAEILCDKFKENKITFHNGLNVVLGDDQATNSIGKSSLLMVIDFVFGGETFINNNKDVVSELDHHEYHFSFIFDGKPHFFKRGTYKPELIYTCSDKYVENKPISLDEYKDFLKKAYGLSDIELSFRSCVSLFSRVWGKENLDVKQPLHSFKKQRSSDCIDNTLKMYKKYESIRLLAAEVKKKNDEKSALNGAIKEKFIPKITKPEYKKNLETITGITKEIEEIKINLAKYAININEIANKEVLELKEQKDSLLTKEINIKSRLSRVKNDLDQNKYIKSKHLKPLSDFFPDLDTSRIASVEMFHSEISRILRSELRESEKELTSSLALITDELNKIDRKIGIMLENVENPSIIVDRVYELSKTHSETSTEIEFFETETKVKNDLKEAKGTLSEEKLKILKLIENIINDKTRIYVDKIYSEKRRNPVIDLGQNSYSFEAVEDTGTGKAYSNLIILDLVFFETTKLPFIIHDSLLFKNIENEAVAKVVDLYESFKKQSFIAIDEIKKYGKDTEKMLLRKKVISLSDSKVLYIKDWRK